MSKQQKILIVGATSAIAEASARRFAQQPGTELCLWGRNPAQLQRIADDLKVRGASRVETLVFDANDFASHEAAIAQSIALLGEIDAVLIAHGSLGDQKACEQSFDATLAELNTNAISVISLLTRLANYFEARKQGSIVVIGSVAGDRGRQSNYIYGTAKGALAIFLQGLRNRLHKSGVSVITIKPGFVDTPMTASFKKGALWAQPETIAFIIEKAVANRADVVYAPFFWRYIMLIIRLIPETIFKRGQL